MNKLLSEFQKAKMNAMRFIGVVFCKGEYTAYNINGNVSRDDPIISCLSQAIRNNDQRYIDYLILKGIISVAGKSENIIPTSGRNILARHIVGNTAYDGGVDYGAIGDAASPSFTNSSTQLNNEVFRLQAISRTFNLNIAYVDWYIEPGDVSDDTYTEFGAFIAGSASADSGQAWSLLATGGWVKSGGMFISAKYTFS